MKEEAEKKSRKHRCPECSLAPGNVLVGGMSFLPPRWETCPRCEGNGFVVGVKAMSLLMEEQGDNQQMKAKTMTILVIGDSWASAIESDTRRDEGWPLIMGIAPEMRQGVAGSTAAQWADDQDGWLTRAQHTEADAVIVSLLGNDARAAVSDGRVTADEIAAGLRDMRAVIEAVQRPLTIVLLYADPFCGAQAQSRVAVPLLNGAIRWACNGIPVVYADTGAWLTREHFDGRDIHPTRAGHAVIADRMIRMFEHACL